MPSTPDDEFFSFARFMESVMEEDRAPLQQRIESALQSSSGGQFHAEYRVMTSPMPGKGNGNGTDAPRWIAARGRVEYDAKGAPLRMRGISVDISERKRAEEEAQARQNEVMHLARLTTLGEISGSLAHELNQPLGAILANAEAGELYLGRTTPDVAEVREILADIRKDGLRARDIVQGTRSFLRRKSMNLEPLQLGDLLRETARMISSDAASRKTTVSLHIAENLPMVYADRVHLQQVIVNLFVNGMDAMESIPLALRRLTLSAVPCDNGSRVEISVSDAGIGIAAGQLPMIFQPFYTSKRGGLGLGLAISQSIVQVHGGSLAVENNADRGATARLRLPVHALVNVDEHKTNTKTLTEALPA
ncbi:MAG: sensor histidine kinase [Candidatus Methylacidiphilales bacterium]